MEADRSIVNLIVKECCKGIEYDEMLEQYSFALHSRCEKRWESLRTEIREISSRFVVDDFNEVLTHLKIAHKKCKTIHLNEGICNRLLLTGESIEVRTSQEIFILVKMGPNQYLSNFGKGMTFRSDQMFEKGIILETSEGIELVTILEVSLRLPTFMHIALGRHMLGTYYKRKIHHSLWDLYYLVEEVRNDPVGSEMILNKTRELGIGVLPMITIINSYNRK